MTQLLDSRLPKTAIKTHNKREATIANVIPLGPTILNDIQYHMLMNIICNLFVTFLISSSQLILTALNHTTSQLLLAVNFNSVILGIVNFSKQFIVTEIANGAAGCSNVSK
jgi:hypothetical protein